MYKNKDQHELLQDMAKAVLNIIDDIDNDEEKAIMMTQILCEAHKGIGELTNFTLRNHPVLKMLIGGKQ